MSDLAKHFSAQELSELSQHELVAIVLKQQANWLTTDIDSAVPSQYDSFCRQVAENFPNGAVAILDRNMTYLHVAGEAIHQLGLTEAQFIGLPLGVIVAPTEAIRLQTELQGVLQGKRCFTDTTIGDETYLITASPLTSIHGTVNRVLAVSQNITVQQAALRQAQESEAQFRTLAESIPGAVYLSTNDQKRKVLYISQNITGLCGYLVEDFLEGRITASNLIHPDDRDATEQGVVDALANRHPYRLTYRLQHREGHTCWIEEYGANVVKEGKQYFQGVLFDITKKKEYEEELLRQNEELKRINTELDRFSYSVSHDLRAPLTSALGLMHLLKTEEDPAQSAHYVKLAEQCLHQLNNFIQEVMSLTQNARTDLAIEKVDLNKIVSEVVSSQQQTADQNQVVVHNDIKPGETLYTDRQRLSTVLNNLISNAIRYYRSNQEHPYVKITATVSAQQVTLCVEDNGIGIDEQHIKNIYNMFYRATDHVSGSGLGLYLVKETVQMLKGEITVRSQRNQGTTFTVILPSLK